MLTFSPMRNFISEREMGFKRVLYKWFVKLGFDWFDFEKLITWDFFTLLHSLMQFASFVISQTTFDTDAVICQTLYYFVTQGMYYFRKIELTMQNTIKRDRSLRGPQPHYLCQSFSSSEATISSSFLIVFCFFLPPHFSPDADGFDESIFNWMMVQNQWT